MSSGESAFMDHIKLFRRRILGRREIALERITNDKLVKNSSVVFMEGAHKTHFSSVIVHD